MQDGASMARFHREAALLQSLPHPNILAIEGWGEIDGRHYIVTELAVGGPISDRIPLEPAAALEVVQQVCAALAFAHAHGIVHRDVKPHNVLVAADGVIKLGDFGTARQLAATTQRITETGDVVGTPYYLAPEAMHGAPHDPRMDVYAVGVLLYHLITGTLPIGYFEPLAGALDSVVRRALAHNPDRRYSTIAELTSDLIRAQQRSASATTSGARRGIRRAAVAAFGVAVVSLVGWSLWPASERGVDPERVVAAAPGEPPRPGQDAGASPTPARADSGVPARPPLGPEHDPRNVDAGGSPTPTRNREIRAAPGDTKASRAAIKHDRSGAKRVDAKQPLPGVAEATIIIAVRPWAEVHIDGVPRGRAEPPTARFRVAPGEHTVVLSHPITGVRTTRKVTVERRTTVEIRADIGRASSDPTP